MHPLILESSLMDLLQRPHALAIVASSPMKSNLNINTNTTHNNNNNNSSTSSSPHVPRQHTLLMLTKQAPTEELCMWCVSFMNITTHMREWTALMSIRSNRLMPLAPYLLKASPVVSSVSLRYIHTCSYTIFTHLSVSVLIHLIINLYILFIDSTISLSIYIFV